MRWQVSLTSAAADRMRALGLLARAEALEPPAWLAVGDFVALDVGDRLQHLRVARRTLVLGEEGEARVVLLLDVPETGPR